MSEQQKQPNPGRLIIISAIILAAVVILTGCKKQPAELTKTKHRQAEPTTLNEIIKAAKSWHPAYISRYGKMAPDFTLTDIAGKQHKLSDYRGKDVILTFWAIWSPPCQTVVPHLIELRKTISEDKLVMLVISNEKPDLLKRFVAKQKINYTVLLDKGDMPVPFGVMRIHRAIGIPCSFFIDHEGKIKLAASGLVPLDDVKAILRVPLLELSRP